MSAPRSHPLLLLPKFGSGPGLHRVEALIDALDLVDYLYGTPRIAVTGTNGKGSTAKLTAEILRHGGRRTGLFTSPHLYRFNERFEIEGLPVADHVLVPAMDDVLAAVRGYERDHPDDKVGAFEAFFVLAIRLFQHAGCRALVLEAGIGGRYDAVRVALARIGAVVSVDYDHTEILGSTLRHIALDKMEIVSRSGWVFLGRSLAPLSAEIETHGHMIGVRPYHLDDECALEIRSADALGTLLDLKVGQRSYDSIRLALPGAHQAENLALAVLLATRLDVFDTRDWSDAIRAAASGTRWPGRLERVLEDPAVTIDVGHSPAAIEAALEAFAAHNDLSRCLLVIGCSRDKNAEGMVRLLAPRFPRILCTSAHHKGAPAAEIAGFARAASPSARIEAVEPIARAAERALAICRAEGRAAYVAGGLFVATEIAHALRGGDARELRFL